MIIWPSSRSPSLLPPSRGAENEGLLLLAHSAQGTKLRLAGRYAMILDKHFEKHKTGSESVKVTFQASQRTPFFLQRCRRGWRLPFCSGLSFSE